MAQRLAGRFEARPMVAINLTPLVPVLLAVFAVIAATAVVEKPSVSLDSPPGDCFGTCKAPATIFVNLLLDGRVLIDGETVSRHGAPQAVVARSRAYPERPIMIRADADVPYAAVFSIYDSVKGAGLRSPTPITEELH